MKDDNGCYYLLPTVNIFHNNIDDIFFCFQKLLFCLSYKLIITFFYLFSNDPLPGSNGSDKSQHLKSQFPCPLCNFVAFESTALEGHFIHSHPDNNDNALYHTSSNNNSTYCHESDVRNDFSNSTNFSVNGMQSASQSNSGEVGSEVSHNVS